MRSPEPLSSVCAHSSTHSGRLTTLSNSLSGTMCSPSARIRQSLVELDRVDTIDQRHAVEKSGRVPGEELGD
jgi:hypothetical protein